MTLAPPQSPAQDELAHDLRTLFASIRAGAEHARAGGDSGTENQLSAVTRRLPVAVIEIIVNGHAAGAGQAVQAAPREELAGAVGDLLDRIEQGLTAGGSPLHSMLHAEGLAMVRSMRPGAYSDVISAIARATDRGPAAVPAQLPTGGVVGLPATGGVPQPVRRTAAGAADAPLQMRLA